MVATDGAGQCDSHLFGNLFERQEFGMQGGTLVVHDRHRDMLKYPAVAVAILIGLDDTMIAEVHQDQFGTVLQDLDDLPAHAVALYAGADHVAKFLQGNYNTGHDCNPMVWVVQE